MHRELSDSQVGAGAARPRKWSAFGQATLNARLLTSRVTNQTDTSSPSNDAANDLGIPL